MCNELEASLGFWGQSDFYVMREFFGDLLQSNSVVNHERKYHHHHHHHVPEGLGVFPVP